MTKQELEACIDEYGKDIYSFCRHLAGSRQEADDLYQDTFLKAVELSQNIDDTGNPKSYLLSISVRIWKNKKRKFAWRKRIADICPITEEKDAQIRAPEELLPEQQVLGREKQELVRQAVDHLPKQLRVIVLLYYMEELSTRQIAAVLKIPAGTVKSRLYQARKRLEKELEDVLYE